MLPDPGSTETTPGGKPALTVSSAHLRAVRGVTLAGFITTVLPVRGCEQFLNFIMIHEEFLECSGGTIPVASGGTIPVASGGTIYSPVASGGTHR